MRKVVRSKTGYTLLINAISLPLIGERDYLVTEPKIQLSDVKKSHFTLNSSLLKIQEVDYFFNQPKIQPIDTQSLINNPVRFLWIIYRIMSI